MCSRLARSAEERKQTPLARGEADAEKVEMSELRALREQWWARASWPVRVATVLLVSALTLAVIGFVYGSCIPN